MTRYIFQRVWTVFLYPETEVSFDLSARRAFNYYQGRLSSASTGRFAADLLPLEFALEVKSAVSSAGGASISMSSSKSDMLEELVILAAMSSSALSTHQNA